jgi:hypothetical protein
MNKVEAYKAIMGNFNNDSPKEDTERLLVLIKTMSAEEYIEITDWLTARIHEKYGSLQVCYQPGGKNGRL